MNEKSFIGQQIMGLLKNSRLPLVKNIAGVVGPAMFDTAANYIDMTFDPEKAAMEYYANEFNPSPKQIESLQDVKDFIGGFSSVPMAPPFLGRGEWDRGYLPVANLSMGTDTSGGIGMYDPYPEMAMKHNAGMRSYEKSQNEAAKRPFEDWAKLHEAVLDRQQKTYAFQAGLRKDPSVIAAAKGDPRLLAKIIHKKTLERNSKTDQVKAGDMLRYTLMNDEVPKFGSMKLGTTQAHSLELPDMTGRRPYIIR